MFPPGISGNPQGCHSQSLHFILLPTSFPPPSTRASTSNAQTLKRLTLSHFRTSPHPCYSLLLIPLSPPSTRSIVSCTPAL